MTKLVTKLPYGQPLDWDDLSMKAKFEVVDHQYAVKRWAKRVQKKMTQGLKDNEEGE